MIGMIVWIPAEQRKLGVTERRVMHMSFLCVQIPRGPRTPEWMLRRRIRWAAAKLHRLGIKQVVLPEDFPWLDLLEKKGLRTVETTGLRRRLAVEWTRAALEARGMPGTQVAVSARKMTAEVVRTVTELARGTGMCWRICPGAGKSCAADCAGNTAYPCSWGRTGSSWSVRKLWCCLIPGRI